MLRQHFLLLLYSLKRSIFLYPDSVVLYTFALANSVLSITLPWYVSVVFIGTTLLFFIQRESILLGNIIALLTYYTLYTHYAVFHALLFIFICFVAQLRFTMRNSADKQTALFLRSLLEQERCRYD